MKVLYAKCENGHFFDANIEKCPRCGSSVYTLLGEKPHKNKDAAEKKKPDVKLKKKDRLANAGKKLDADEHKPDVEADESITDVWKDFPNTVSAGTGADAAAGSATAVVRLSGLSNNAAKASDEQTEPGNEVRDDSKTIAFWDKASDTGNEPVVGWLVCIKGATAGESYELKTGANKVGRLVDVNDVVISEDLRISRREHLVIIYEPKKRKFYLQQGEGMSLSYLNGELLNGTTILRNRDEIVLGESTLVFVPLCNDDFSWNN